MLTRTQFMTINNDWKNSGLKLPSVIRIHKIATLEKDMVEMIMGQIAKSTKNKIQTIISKLTDLKNCLLLISRTSPLSQVPWARPTL